MGLEGQIIAFEAAVPQQSKLNSSPPADVEFLRDSVDAIRAALALIAKDIGTVAPLPERDGRKWP